MTLWRKYQKFRNNLSSLALFALALLEVLIFLAFWAGTTFVLATILLAPFIWGLWGMLLWAVVYALVCALGAVLNRPESDEQDTRP